MQGGRGQGRRRGDLGRLGVVQRGLAVGQRAQQRQAELESSRATWGSKVILSQKMEEHVMVSGAPGQKGK